MKRVLKFIRTFLRFVAFQSLLCMIGVSIAQAAPKAEVWPRWQKHDPANAQKIDHSAWDRFLKQNVVAPHPSGINRVRYQAVSPDDQKSLKNYLLALQALAISNFNRNEQKAYWINLYNALTVELIITRFPLASIRDINISPGLYGRGLGAPSCGRSKAKNFPSTTSNTEFSGRSGRTTGFIMRSIAPASAVRIFSRWLTPPTTAKRCWKKARASSSTMRVA